MKKKQKKKEKEKNNEGIKKKKGESEKNKENVKMALIKKSLKVKKMKKKERTKINKYHVSKKKKRWKRNKMLERKKKSNDGKQYCMKIYRWGWHCCWRKFRLCRLRMGFVSVRRCSNCWVMWHSVNFDVDGSDHVPITWLYNHIIECTNVERSKKAWNLSAE